MNQRSIATVSISGALDEKLRAIAAAGFTMVEIFEADLISSGARPREIAKLCADLGLSICAYQPFRDFEGMPEPQRARNFIRAERKFDLMQQLGTDLLLICMVLTLSTNCSGEPLLELHHGSDQQIRWITQRSPR